MDDGNELPGTFHRLHIEQILVIMHIDHFAFESHLHVLTVDVELGWVITVV